MSRVKFVEGEPNVVQDELQDTIELVVLCSSLAEMKQVGPVLPDSAEIGLISTFRGKVSKNTTIFIPCASSVDSSFIYSTVFPLVKQGCPVLMTYTKFKDWMKNFQE